MPSDCIPFRETGYFSSLICDYLEESSQLRPFYNRFPNIENFKAQISEKKLSFNNTSRNVLVSSLKKQYRGFNVSKETTSNIESLTYDNTFTITTGHQLNLFTGPLYFFYKIITTINLCKDLKKHYPENHFVPVYWMATEDHDFDEINFFNFQGKKVQWTKAASGAVGEVDLSGLDDVYKAFSVALGLGKNAESLKALFTEAYLNHKTLAEASRYLVNELFSKFGLVIIDGNDADLKRLFVPYIKDELTTQTTFKNVTETNERLNALNAQYKIQVNPREINLFYLKNKLRERIVENQGIFQVLETDISWNQHDLLLELEKHPEHFSPNVLTRPLFQEVVLPNLCYIGGGGELAYWFQLKSNFETQKVPFPILLLRNSVLLITNKQNKKREKLELAVSDLFLKQDDLVSKWTRKHSNLDIDFTAQKDHLKKQFQNLYTLAEQTDPSFIGAVAAQERKQIKGLEHLEKRLLKAEKRRHIEYLDRITALQNELFPNQSLQERYANFSNYYLEYGDQLIQELVLNLQPLKGEFTIINLD